MSAYTHSKKPNQHSLSLEDIFLSEENQQQIQQLLDEYSYRNALKKYGIPIDNKILLYGPSGCGKTATANAIAQRLNKKIISLQLGGFVSYRLGETAKNITAVFRNARLENAVLFIDEFDFLGKARDYDEKDSGEMKRLVNTILQHIDELESDTLLIGATNFVEVIDPALLRRFQIKLSFDMPNPKQLDEYYDHILHSIPKEFIHFERLYDISYAEAKDYAYHHIKQNIIKAEKKKSQLIFSYGTLQQENVQQETYGRLLKGANDVLKGYKLDQLEINEASVVEKSGKNIHLIAVKTGNKEDIIKGKVFEITTDELLQTDRYEVEAYVRVEEKLESGKKAWVYIKK